MKTYIVGFTNCKAAPDKRAVHVSIYVLTEIAKIY